MFQVLTFPVCAAFTTNSSSPASSSFVRFTYWGRFPVKKVETEKEDSQTENEDGFEANGATLKPPSTLGAKLISIKTTK